MSSRSNLFFPPQSKCLPVKSSSIKVPTNPFTGPAIPLNINRPATTIVSFQGTPIVDQIKTPPVPEPVEKANFDSNIIMRTSIPEESIVSEILPVTVEKEETIIESKPTSGRRVSFPRSVSAPRCRLSAEPRAEKERNQYPEVPQNWGQKLLQQKRDQLEELFKGMGYKLLAILMTTDDNNRRSYYAITLTPKGYYVFISLQDRETYFTDETWKFQENTESLEILPESIKTSCHRKEIDGIVHINEFTICISKLDDVVESIITKKFSLAKDSPEEETKIQLGSYYLVPLISIHTVMENPKKAEEMIFKSIREIRQSNQNTISSLETFASGEFSKLRDLMVRLENSHEQYEIRRANLVKKWNTTGQVDFYRMDRIISEIQGFDIRELKHLNKRLHKINSSLEALVSKIDNGADDLARL